MCVPVWERFLLKQGLLGTYVYEFQFPDLGAELFFLRDDASLERRAEMVSTSSSCTIEISISLSISPVFTAPMNALSLQFATNVLPKYTLSQTCVRCAYPSDTT